MSDYTQIVYFAPKDALITGNPAKKVKGTEWDAELAAIATAILSKLDSSDVASNAEAAALASTSKLITPASLLYGIANGNFQTAQGFVLNLPTVTPVGGDLVLIRDQSAGELANVTVTALSALATPAAASTTVAGVAELATSTETITGTDTGRTVTPDGLHDMFFSCQWDNGGSWNKRSAGASTWSLTKNGSGDYTITHNLALTNAYDIQAVASPVGVGADQYFCHVDFTVNTIRVYCYTDLGGAGDPARFNLIAMRGTV
jgi:hypothetical protein